MDRGARWSALLDLLAPDVVLLGDGGGVELFERHHFTGLEQAGNLVRTNISLGQAGGQSQGSSSEQGGQGFHGVCPS